MDVKSVLTVATVPEDFQDSVEVIHSALHCRPAVDVDYGWPGPVADQELSEVIIVNLARLQRLDLHVAHKASAVCTSGGVHGRAS